MSNQTNVVSGDKPNDKNIYNFFNRDARTDLIRGSVVLGLFDKIFTRISHLLDNLVSKEYNPIHLAGAIANTSFAIAVVSGIILLLWYVPSVNQAYHSLVEMDRNPYTTGLVRSIHRYSSDVCMLFAILHGLKMFVSGKFDGSRWVAWVTGIFSFGLLWFIGWIGYWLVWDARGQLVAISSSKLVDIIPIFAEPLSRSFVAEETLNTFLFFVVFFFHMLIPLPLVLGLWMHIMRLNRPKFLLDKKMSLWLFVGMVVISVLKPAHNVEPANLAKLNMNITIDYFYVFPLYIFQKLSAELNWTLSAVLTLGILLIPWALVKRKTLKSSVNIDTCNSCKTCYKDCPYNAITMVQLAGGDPKKPKAKVNPNLCVGCGICAGSCSEDSVNLPLFNKDILNSQVAIWKDEANRAKKELNLAFICENFLKSKLQLNDQTGESKELSNYKIVPIPCVGWIHKKSTLKLLDNGVSEIFVAGCSDNDCDFREGPVTLDARLDRGEAAEKQKHLHYHKFMPGDVDSLIQTANSIAQKKSVAMEVEVPKAKKMVSLVLVSAVFLAITVFFSDLPYSTPKSSSQSEFVFSFKLAGEVTQNCGQVSKEDLEKLPPHMRQAQKCERKRSYVMIRVYVDDKMVSEKSFKPQGIWEDGISVGLMHIPVEPGTHTIKVELSDKAGIATFPYSDSKSLTFKDGFRNVGIFSKTEGFIWH